MSSEEVHRKVYLPYPVFERYIAGRTDCGEWLPYLEGRKAVSVTTPSVAAKAYAILRASGDPEAVAAADQSEEQLKWHLTE